MEIYGNKRPSECAIGNPPPTEAQIAACKADTRFGPNTLFANSQPRARYQKGLLWITGNASPGVYVDVTVTDAVAKDANGKWIATGRSVRESYLTATSASPAFGIEAGDLLEAEDIPSLNVTDLGTHWAGTGGACMNGATAPGCDPTSQEPADWGPSTLYVLAVARGPHTGETSDVWTNGTGALPTITKYAGAPVPVGSQGDKTAPAYLVKTYNSNGTPQQFHMTWPPQHWCHLSSKGAMGGNYDGTCTAGVPDVSWLALGCYPPDQFPNPWPRDVPRGCPDGNNSRTHTGEANVSGSLTDDVASAYGLASEIADVRVEFLLGGALVPGRGPYHPLVRNGCQAGYSQKVRINDFEPNFPPFTSSYTAKVTISDAWGNSASVQSNFAVYPW